MKKSTLLLLATILMFNSPVQAAAAVDEAEQNLSFPKPSGPYSIGYQHVELTDKERIDPYNPKPEQNRQVKVTVWYPSQDAAKLENYSIDEMALSEQNKEQILKNLPPDLRVQTQQAIDRHAQIKIYRSFNAQPAQGKFPVIVLSPGWGNKSVSYQRIGQELVSHGYIVMAIHHPYLTGRVKFRDGVVKARENIESEEALRIFTADVAFVLKSLPDISSQLGLQETDRIGLMGHSLGGEATMRTVHNPLFKVRAAVHLDSLLIPEPLSQEEQ